MAYIEQNAEYLEKQLYFLGVKVDQTQLRQKMDKEKSFQLTAEKASIQNDEIIAKIKLDRSKQGYYFLNNIEVEIRKVDKLDNQKRNFKVSKELAFTLVECYRLMQGKSVYKENDKNLTANQDGKWHYLDAKNLDKNGQPIIRSKIDPSIFSKIDKLPIKNYDIPQVKAKIIEDIKKGGQAFVVFLKNGQEKKGFIDVAAKYSSINEYGENRQRIYAQQVDRPQKTTPIAPARNLKGEENGQQTENKKEQKNGNRQGKRVGKPAKSV